MYYFLLCYKNYNFTIILPVRYSLNLSPPTLRFFRNANAEYLTKRLSEIEGIQPLKRDPRVTVHSYHLYIFRFNSESFKGLTRERFIEALRAEGIPCSQGYRPLNKMSFIQEYLRTETSLPVTEKACEEEAVWLKQNILLGTREDMDDVADAILKIKENVEELL